MYGPVLGASTTTAAVLALPNTGSNALLTSVVIVALLSGIIVTISSIARILATRTSK